MATNVVSFRGSTSPRLKSQTDWPHLPTEERKDVVDRKLERFDTRSWFEPAVAEGEDSAPDLAWVAPHVLFLAGHGWGNHPRNHGSCRNKTMSQAARYSHLSPQHTQSVVDRIAETGTGQANMHQNMLWGSTTKKL